MATARKKTKVEKTKESEENLIVLSFDELALLQQVLSDHREHILMDKVPTVMTRKHCERIFNLYQRITVHLMGEYVEAEDSPWSD